MFGRLQYMSIKIELTDFKAVELYYAQLKIIIVN